MGADRVVSSLLYKPKYIITNEILNLVTQITSRVDAAARNDIENDPGQRKINHLRVVHSTLAIENNTLSLEQIAALSEKKKVIAPSQDIIEAKNAFEAYDRIQEFDPYDVLDLLNAHQILMKNLLKEPGRFRTGNIAVARGNDIVHIAPPADNVSGLMSDLLQWTENADIHPLIKSSVFHYEFEIIHPFPDGNGRMGRLWQSLLLRRWKKIFTWLPVEAIVWERRQEYYAALGRSNDADDCTEFILFILQTIWDTLNKYAPTDQETDQETDQVKRLLRVLGTKILSASELMEMLELKHRPTFRVNYLRPAINAGLVEMTLPQNPTARNQKYRRKMI